MFFKRKNINPEFQEKAAALEAQPSSTISDEVISRVWKKSARRKICTMPSSSSWRKTKLTQ